MRISIKSKTLKIIALFLLSVLFIATPVFRGFAEEYDKTYSTYVCGNAHIDTAWNWRISNTVGMVGQTYGDAIKLIDSNPGYVFNGTAAKHFSWIKEYYPDMWEDVKTKIASGRIDFSSGWVEHDTNLPSGEAMVRQYLMAQNFYEKEFGRKTTEAVMPDDFGDAWILPQILKKSGINNFVSTRVSAIGGEPNGTGGRIGQDIFNWIGVDGSRILFYKPSPWYNATAVPHDIDISMQYPMSIGIKKGMYLSGKGDAGGGPTQDDIDDVLAVDQKSGMPRAKFKKVSDFFKDFSSEDRLKVNLEYNNELFYWTCQGTFTTQAAMKKYNRQSEIAADTAEKFGSIAMSLGLAAYPTEKLNTAWNKILTNQFHDILPGSAVHEVYDDAWNDSEIALNLIKSGTDNSLDGIASAADTRGDGVPVVVFNPLSFTRNDIVETEVSFENLPKAVKVFDSDNNELPVQIEAIQGNALKILFEAKDMPSIGYKVFRVVPVSALTKYETGLTATENYIESNYYKVEINPENGNIKRILDKKNNKEVLEEGKEIELQKIEDNGNAWDISLEDLSKAPEAINDKAEIKLLESGPVRAVYEIKKVNKSLSVADPSTYTQKIVVYANSDRIDIPMEVDWHESSKLLKVAFPLKASSPEATYDLSYGTISRGNNNEQRFEVYGHKWADLTDCSGDFGVSILNDCKYGWDKPDNNTLRLSLLRSAKSQDVTADEGEHTFTYSLYSHSEDWKKGNTPEKAYELNYPLIAKPTVYHKGTLGKTYSFVTVDQPNIMVTAVKKAESVGSEDLILRLFETQGKEKTDTTVTMVNNIKSISEANLLEEKIDTQDFDKKSFNTSLGKYEIKTFRLKLDSKVVKNGRPDVTKVDLSSAFNLRGISNFAERSEDSLDDNGGSIPSELLPKEIISEDVIFATGPRNNGDKNVVQAKGQVIKLPKGKYDCLYLLGTGAGEDTAKGVFTVQYDNGSKTSQKLEFGDWTSPVGGWNKPLINDTIGISLTHNLIKGDNNREQYNNLFVYKIPLEASKKVTGITLPKARGIKIVGISLVKGGFRTDLNSGGSTGIAGMIKDNLMWAVAFGILAILIIVLFLLSLKGKEE